MLPAHQGLLYRGINVRFSEREYRVGQPVCWASFSSASAQQSVAKEFVKGDEGSLFFLHSTGARAISRFSKFPDEAEVLFRPNTIFEITSTLYGTSDIGQFYSGIDNISMAEQTVSVSASPRTTDPGPGDPDRRASLLDVAPVFNFPPAMAGGDTVVVSVPPTKMASVLTSLAYSHDLAIDTLQTYEDLNAGHVAHVTMVSDAAAGLVTIPTPRSLIAHPDPCDPPGACTPDYAALGVPSGSARKAGGRARRASCSSKGSGPRSSGEALGWYEFPASPRRAPCLHGGDAPRSSTQSRRGAFSGPL